MDKPNCDQCRIGMELTHYEKSWSGQYTLKFECWNCHSTTEAKPDHASQEELEKMLNHEKTEEEKLQVKLVLGKNMMHQRLMAHKKGSAEEHLTHQWGGGIHRYREEEELFMKEGDFSQDRELQEFIDYLKKRDEEMERRDKELEPKIRSDLMINCWTNKEDEITQG